MADRPTTPSTPPTVRCAIYTRKSTEENLELDFNSLDAQREAAEAYIASQKHAGWVAMPDRYDDGGFSGGTIDRPAFQRLMADVEEGRVGCVVVYKIDRLSRSLMDFARIMEVLDRRNVSLVSVTQQFNTTTSMGRLTLNILLSFAQFEREIISERTRDKIAAARRKGKWTGGSPILGYDRVRDSRGTRLVVNETEAEQVRAIFQKYLKVGSLMAVAKWLNQQGWLNKAFTTTSGNRRTATALVGPHSKASLSAPRREALADLDMMHDGTLRLRTPRGLRIRRGEQELDCAMVAGVLGEVVLTERALADGAVITGQLPHALLLVENLGAYLDIPAPSGWLLAHVPGWDTRTVRLLLRQLRDVPVAHFGDLDPNGVRIMRHLRDIRPDLRWVVPEFWSEYVPKAGLPASWPSDFDLGDVPALVKQLAASDMWLEQEVIVLDPRLPQALALCIAPTA